MGEGGELPGATAFKLYDTFGFPYDLTEDALRARGIAVDRAGFDAAMAEQKAAARAAWKGSGDTASRRSVVRPGRERRRDRIHRLHRATTAKAWSSRWSRTARGSSRRATGETVIVILNQTPFYGESGGQVGDAGKLTALKASKATVEDTSKPLGKLHALRTRIATGTPQGRRHASHQSVDVERRDRDPRQP